jgi:carbon monoxide dehydrogenase subunit G
MTKMKSETVEVNRSPDEVFVFLSDFNNFEKLMPEQVVDWKSDQQSCSFTIKGMASLGMRIDSVNPGKEIKIVRDGKAPFDFTLTCSIAPATNKNQSLLTLQFDADLNPMLQMLAVRPLTNFLNMLVNRYKELA